MKLRALLSVTDKTGIVSLAQGLQELGYELLSTGGTAQALRTSGLPVTEVGELTGFGEMLDGRVKTLHPAVHAGLLADLNNPDHVRQLADSGLQSIQVLVINLYQFEKTVQGPHTFEAAIESIDIGGPAMIRAAAKNAAHVAVVTDPADYDDVLAAARTIWLPSLRPSLQAKAFRHTAYYDSIIAEYLSDRLGDSPFQPTLVRGSRLRQRLRYGENPHQEAALYQSPLAEAGLAHGQQLWGKELSYNNLLDGDAAWELVSDLPPGSCAIIKHGNPCGAALGSSLGESYRLARQSDPISAFGGIAAFHGELDEEGALAATEKGNFLEVVLADGFTPAAVEFFQSRSGWGHDVRLVCVQVSPRKADLNIRAIRGGWLVQSGDELPEHEWTVASQRTPTDDEWAALRFQWAIVAHVKSNAIVVGGPQAMYGCGAGQMNRVQSVRLALEQAGDRAPGAVLASDAFFPFPDSIETAAQAGIRAVVQPGGSKKDPDVIAAADALGLAMVLTGVRRFRH